MPDVFQDKIPAVHIPIQMALDDEHGDTRGGNQQIHAVYQTPAMVSGIRLAGIMLQSPFRLHA